MNIIRHIKQMIDIKSEKEKSETEVNYGSGYAVKTEVGQYNRNYWRQMAKLAKMSEYAGKKKSAIGTKKKKRKLRIISNTSRKRNR